MLDAYQGPGEIATTKPGFRLLPGYCMSVRGNLTVFLFYIYDISGGKHWMPRESAKKVAGLTIRKRRLA